MGQIKIYIMAGLTLVVGILAFLLQNAKLREKRNELQVATTTAKINKDVAKILANRNVTEVMNRVDKEIKKGNVSSLDH